MLKKWGENGIGVEWIVEKCLILCCVLFTCRSLILAFDKDEYMPLYSFLSLFVARMTVPIGALYLLRTRKCTRENVWLLILPVSYWIMQVVHTYGGYTGGGELTFFSSAVFVLLPNEMKKKIFNAFYMFIQATNVLSLVLWGIFIFGGISFFHQEMFYAQSGLEVAYYYRFAIFAIYKYGHSFPRLCGIFNEPGALGTVCALLYICTFKKSKPIEKALLIITGIMTFSFAFFLMLILFLAAYFFLKNPRNIIVLVVMAAIILMLPYIDFHNDALNETAARFAITSNGFAGDNRTSNEFDLEYEKFKNSKYLWFGRGAGVTLATGTASYKSNYVVPYGILGTVFLLGSWLWAALCYSKKERHCLLYDFFFFLSLYQRPYAIISFWGYIFLFGGIEWIKAER